MKQVIGVGIVGTGLAFQAIHARSLASMPADFAVRAVWDPDCGRADAAGQWLGARVATDCEDLFADPDVDVVVLASPARFHAEQAIAAINAGKRAVLVEKPLCATPDEADAIAALRCIAQFYGRLPIRSGHACAGDVFSSSTESVVECASFGPVGRSFTAVHFFHLATVFWLIL